MARLMLIRGLPGSGKSTLADKLCRMNVWHLYFEADMFFINDQGRYVFDAMKLRQAHNKCFDDTREALSHGYSVIVANTFTTKKELQPYFLLAESRNITPEVILCQGNYGSIHDVPANTINAMKKRFEYDISDLFTTNK